MSTFSTIAVLETGESVSLVLRRPPLNVMNITMMQEMNAALEQLLAHSGPKVLVIRAEGKAFSAGVDIADHTAEKVGTMMKEFHRIFELLNQFAIPVVAAVDGAALGGGCELAIFCDMIIASERAKFGQPEINVGVFPPVAAIIAPRLIGRNRALEWLMSGEAITAAEAERIGLVNRVYPVEAFEEQVKAFVGKFTAQSRVIAELTKKALDRGLRRPVMEGLADAENLYMNEMMRTEDANEGLKAFLEKRKPVWKNR